MRLPLNEFDIIQNTAIGAVSITSFAKAYFEAKNELTGPTLPMFMPVLPIVFNRESTTALYRKHLRGGLLSGLANNRLINVGLNERMFHLRKKTLNSIGICLNFGYLSFNKETGEFLPDMRKKLPVIAYEENDRIIKTSSRLGYWFSERQWEEICILLNIHF